MYRFALAGLLSVLFVVPATAQSPPSHVFTEADFLSVLDESHPAAIESSEALALARAQIVEASTFENPSVRVEREDLSGPEEQTDVSVSWQLPAFGRRAGITAREEAANAASARLVQHRLGLRLTMKEAYADWAFARARQERLIDHVQRVENLAEREHLRVTRGEASGLEAHRLDLAANSLRTRALLAGAAVEEARSRVIVWHPALPLEARPEVPAVPPPPELAEDDHPLIRAAGRDLAAARLEEQAAGYFVSSPEISLGWQRQQTETESINGAVFGLSWSVPIFARNRAQKAATEARVSAANARLERIRREVQSARVAALQSFQTLSAGLKSVEVALEQNERMLDGAEAAFRHGEANLTDLLDTQSSVTEFELGMLDLQEAALAEYRKLERVAGYEALPKDPSRLKPELKSERKP